MSDHMSAWDTVSSELLKDPDLKLFVGDFHQGHATAMFSLAKLSLEARGGEMPVVRNTTRQIAEQIDDHVQWSRIDKKITQYPLRIRFSTDLNETSHVAWMREVKQPVHDQTDQLKIPCYASVYEHTDRIRYDE